MLEWKQKVVLNSRDRLHKDVFHPLIARHDEDIYCIFFHGWEKYRFSELSDLTKQAKYKWMEQDNVVLTINNEIVYRVELYPSWSPQPYFASLQEQANKVREQAMESCKIVAEQRVKERFLYYLKVLKSIPKDNVLSDGTTWRDYFLSCLPEYMKKVSFCKGRYDKMILKLHRKFPTWPVEWIIDRLKRKGKITRPILTPNLQTLQLTVWPTRFAANLVLWKEEHKALHKQIRKHAKLARKQKALVEPIKIEHPVPLISPIREPATRSKSGTPMIYTTDKYPIRLKKTKWKAIREWAEAVRDYFEKKRIYLRVQCLSTFIHNREFQPRDGDDKKTITKKTRKRELSAKRLVAIYSNEWKQEIAKARKMFEIALSRPKEEVNAPAKTKQVLTKDKYGYRVGTRAAMVNEVLSSEFLTEDRLRKMAGCDRAVHSHLSNLVQKGIVTKKRFRSKKTGERITKYALASGPVAPVKKPPKKRKKKKIR